MRAICKSGRIVLAVCLVSGCGSVPELTQPTTEQEQQDKFTFPEQDDFSGPTETNVPGFTFSNLNQSRMNVRVTDPRGNTMRDVTVEVWAGSDNPVFIQQSMTNLQGECHLALSVPKASGTVYLVVKKAFYATVEYEPADGVDVHVIVMAPEVKES